VKAQKLERFPYQDMSIRLDAVYRHWSDRRTDRQAERQTDGQWDGVAKTVSRSAPRDKNGFPVRLKNSFN